MFVNADKKLNNVSELNEYKQENIIDICDVTNSVLYTDTILEISEKKYLSDKKNKPIFYKVKNDPRITKFGRFLRTSSIDELPQLFNVLKGNMSIVGNRPLPEYEAVKLTTDDKIARFLVPSGLTGLWQTEKYNGDIDQQKRIELDNYYAKHNTFLGDLTIILKTFKVLIKATNA